MHPADLAPLLPIIRATAVEAGEAVLWHYGGTVSAETKADGSPVTVADRASEAVILAALGRATPGWPVVSEEAAAGQALDGPPGPVFWLVDPLDGTKEFLARTGEFTVNIALIANQQPVLGVVFTPPRQELFLGHVGVGATAAFGRDDVDRPIAARRPSPDGLVVISSRSHGNPEQIARHLAGRRVAESRQAGSSLKFCEIARGAADVYPRFGQTSEWDTAAGQAVLVAAGGRVVDPDSGAPIRYGKPGLQTPAFVAWGG